METEKHKLNWKNFYRWCHREMQLFLTLVKKYENEEHLEYTHKITCCDQEYIIFTKDTVAESYARRRDVRSKFENKESVPIVFKSALDGTTKTVQFTLEMLETYYRAIFNSWPNFSEPHDNGINKGILIKEHFEGRYVAMQRFGNYIYQLHPHQTVVKEIVIWAKSNGVFLEIYEDDVFPQRQNMRMNPKRADKPQDAPHNVVKLK